MDRFSTEAKLTHTKYGIRSHSAFLEICMKLLIVKKIASHKKIIPIKAAVGDFKPKNNIDQSALSAS